MTKAFDIIQGPIITEKSMALKENYNKYTFKVLKSANKIEIKNAVEEIFKVKVLSVATVNVLPKHTRRLSASLQRAIRSTLSRFNRRNY